MQNTAFNDKDAHYYVRFKWWMLPLIKDGPNSVMDLGCASGVMGDRLLKAGKAREVFGVEIFESAAAEAAKFYKKVYTGDIEEMDLEFNEQFDYVICGDILEHLKDPYKVVGRVYRWLKPGGSIFVCVPNIRNYRAMREVVIKGEWRYVDAGVMDKTHLRFFTRRSCSRMISDAGFEVYHEDVVVDGPKRKVLDKATFGAFHEFLGEQTFCCGRRPAAGQN